MMCGSGFGIGFGLGELGDRRTGWDWVEERRGYGCGCGMGEYGRVWNGLG